MTDTSRRRIVLLLDGGLSETLQSMLNPSNISLHPTLWSAALLVPGEMINFLF
eukprot:m.1098635 g.1098635  ORF g.1098635 m.1098635 type:complete len:53 (-) comp24315_c0_seq2:1566-1724(-)